MGFMMSLNVYGAKQQKDNKRGYTLTDVNIIFDHILKKRISNIFFPAGWVAFK
jgi:hypothetical protein